MREVREKSWKTPGRREEAKQEHRMVFQAIKRRDGKKAAEFTLRHLKNTRENIGKIYF